MKTISPTEALQSILSQRTAKAAEIPALNELRDSNMETLIILETTCSLSDEKSLAELARRQTIEALFPRRMAHLERELAMLDEGLLGKCHELISRGIGPRVRELEERASAKARTELAPHFADDGSLDRAVEGSQVVMRARKLSAMCTITSQPTQGLVGYAGQLLQVWADCDAFEKQLAA